MGSIKTGCLKMLGVHFDGAKETYRELGMRYFITYSWRQKMRENKQFSKQLIHLASIVVIQNTLAKGRHLNESEKQAPEAMSLHGFIAHG